MWITIFGSRGRRFANDCHEWRSHKWKSLSNHITSDPKIVIRINDCIIVFVTRYFIFWIHKSAKKGRSFLNKYCDVTTGDLWRHANVGYWHCDVIFVDCSCTRKLAQRWSSLVDNSREYRFLATRHSQLSVYESNNNNDNDNDDEDCGGGGGGGDDDDDDKT